MKIIRLQAENIKRLKAVDITPGGALVRITGQNGAGKSSILDSIYYALAGESSHPAEPIRHGETKAMVKLETGQITITRRFTEKGTTLTVQSADGARYPSQQTMLDAIVGPVSMDPLEFSRLKPREQLETLRRIVPLDVDVDELTRLNQADYDARTDLNRTVKSLRSQAQAIAVPADLPDAPVDVAALMDQMSEIATFNVDIETRRANRVKMAETVVKNRAAAQDIMAASTGIVAKVRTDAEDETNRLKERIAEAERMIAACKDRMFALDAETAQRVQQIKTDAGRDAGALLEDAATKEAKLASAPPLPELRTVDAIRQQIAQATEINRALEAKARRDALEADAKKSEDAANALTEAMEARNHAKAQALITAKMPIPGLGFGNGYVTYNDVPFEQASDAERLRVSVAIAMAMNPKLRVLRVKDGSLLDERSMAILQEMVEANDFQCWIETVGNDGSVGILIEDGEVVSQEVVSQEVADPPTSAEPRSADAGPDQTAMEI